MSDSKKVRAIIFFHRYDSSSNRVVLLDTVKYDYVSGERGVWGLLYNFENSEKTPSYANIYDKGGAYLKRIYFKDYYRYLYSLRRN